MEEASESIELAVGVIIFLIAISLTIMLYTNLHNTIENAVSASTMHTAVQAGSIEALDDAVYDESQIFFMIADMVEKTDETQSDYVYDEYSPYTNPNLIIDIYYLNNSYDPKNPNKTSSKRWTNVSSFVEDMTETEIIVTPHYYSYTGYIGFKNYFRGKKFNIIYEYNYKQLERLNVANHEIKRIIFNEV